MFSGSLTGLSGELVQIMGHIALETTCTEGVDARVIEVNFLIMHDISPYNVILRRPTINALGAVISMLYLTLKYMFHDGKIGTI